MRNRVIVCAVLSTLFVYRSLGQGTISFANHGVNSLGQNWSAPVYQSDGITPLDSSYDVALYTSFSPSLGTLVTGSTTQITGLGLFTGPAVTIGVLSGQPTYFSVVAWQASYGSTWVQAVANGSDYGSSAPFVESVGSSGSPGSLFGMQSFRLIGPIPEPGSLALLGVGCLAFFAPCHLKRV